MKKNKFRCFSFVVPSSCYFKFRMFIAFLGKDVRYFKSSELHFHSDSIIHCHCYVEFNRFITNDELLFLFKFLKIDNIRFFCQLSNKYNRERFDYYLCNHFNCDS